MITTPNMTITTTRGKIKAVCGDLGHCSLLFKSDPNAVYLPPNAVYWLQGSFQRSSLLPLLSFAASPPFKPEKNNTSLSGDQELVWSEITTHPPASFCRKVEIFFKLPSQLFYPTFEVGWRLRYLFQSYSKHQFQSAVILW